MVSQEDKFHMMGEDRARYDAAVDRKDRALREVEEADMDIYAAADEMAHIAGKSVDAMLRELDQ